MSVRLHNGSQPCEVERPQEANPEGQRRRVTGKRGHRSQSRSRAERERVRKRVVVRCAGVREERSIYMYVCLETLSLTHTYALSQPSDPSHAPHLLMARRSALMARQNPLMARRSALMARCLTPLDPRHSGDHSPNGPYGPALRTDTHTGIIQSRTSPVFSHPLICEFSTAPRGPL